MTQLEQALELNRTRQMNVNISVQLASYQMRDLREEEQALVAQIKQSQEVKDAAAVAANDAVSTAQARAQQAESNDAPVA